VENEEREKGKILSVFCNAKDLTNIYERNPGTDLTPATLEDLNVLLSLT